MLNLLNENIKFKFENYSVFLFTLIPFLYILGNAILDIGIVIIAICIFVFNFENIIKNKYFLIISSYFLLISFLSIDIEIILNLSILIRFVLLFSFIALLINNDEKFEKFYLYCFICILSVSIINSFQYFFPNSIPWSQVNTSDSGDVVRVGGLFRNELISGSFLIYFLPFGLIFLKMKKLNYLEIFLLIITFFGILFSGERSAFISFILFCGLYLLKDFKKNVLLIIFLAISISIVFYFNFYIFKRYTIDLYASISNFQSSNYIGLFLSSLKLSTLSLKTILIGNGADSFANICDLNYDLFKNEIYLCNDHPHNFYLEIFYSFGSVPILFLIIFYFKTLIKYFINFRSFSGIQFTLYTSVIVFFMPLKTSNSIFQQRFGFIFFLYLIILMYLNSKKRID